MEPLYFTSFFYPGDLTDLFTCSFSFVCLLRLCSVIQELSGYICNTSTGGRSSLFSFLLFRRESFPLTTDESSAAGFLIGCWRIFTFCFYISDSMWSTNTHTHPCLCDVVGTHDQSMLVGAALSW